MSESQKARRALLQAYLQTIFVQPGDMTPADLERATSSFDGDCSADEVKSLIVKSELAKGDGNPVARLELLKDAEFLASQLDDKKDLGFIYLYLSNVYANGFNGTVSEYYANKALKIFNELGYRKQSIDARMAIVGAFTVKRDYKTTLDSMLSMKKDVMDYSSESYKQFFLDMLARSLDENGRSREAIDLWQGIYSNTAPSANTLAHWANAYLHNNQADSAEILINKAIALPHPSMSDEFLCRNVQYMIAEKLGRRSDLARIDSLRNQAATRDYNDRKIAESSLALNMKYDSVTQSAWKELQANRQRNLILTFILIMALVLLAGSVLYSRNRTRLLRAENENNLLRLQSLEKNLFATERQHNEVAQQLSTIFKAPFETIDHLASAYFECRETTQEQKRIFSEVKKAIDDFCSAESLAKMEGIVNSAHDNLMSSFDEDFPKMSKSQRRLALFIFSGLSLQSISIFQNTDVRNIYVYKSRLKSVIAKSESPRKDLYLAYFG